MKKFYLFLFTFFGWAVQAQVYKHDFGITGISAHPYNVAPTILHTNLSGSSWINSIGNWTSYVGNSGEAIALSNSGGTPTITLTLNVAAGYKLNISSFDFWQQRSATGAQNWSMTINGIAVGAGTVPTSGAAIGTTAVLNPVNNIAGTVTVVISLSAASGTGTYRLDDFILNGTVIPNSYVLLDHFNRNDSIRPAVPSSGGPGWWVEQESGGCLPGSGSALEKIRIKNNMLELASCTYSNSTCIFSQTQSTGINMTGRYPTIFSNASSTLEWYFNMQQSRADPTGFASGQYGAAFVIGSITNDPLAANKSGYAVVFGEAGTSDPLRLVSFNGFAFNSSTFTNILSVPSPAVKTNHMSVKVTFNPCTNEWSLTVRDDGAAFADPSTVTGVGATAVNSTFTSSNLLWLGQVWNHAGSGCTLAKFDNIYIPNAGTKTGTYTWKGNVNTDFQLANNWTPIRQCISTTDKLVINSSSPVLSVITNIPSQTIAQLTVSNSRTLQLSDVAGDAVPATLGIAGSTGTDLQVDAGSAILFDVSSSAAGDAMVIDLAAGATASIAGTVSFNSQVAGTKAHRLLAADAGAISINNGGLVKAMNLSGNPFGSNMPQNTVVFNAGSAYECYSGANPFALAQPNSKVLFNSGSTYRHYAATQPSLLGRIYADYESYVNTDITFGGAAPFTVNSLRILNGTLQFTGISNSQPVHTNIKGDLILANGTAFNYQPVVASTLEFNGSSSAQKINSAGNLTLGNQLTVRLNSSYATAPQLTVETGIAVAAVLDIVQGTIKLDADITLVSNLAGTASLAPISGGISYGSGRFVVERYIPLHDKAWQFLAVPTTGQTVKDAWQEGNAPMVAGTPGRGTIITSHVPGSGFDLIGGTGPSMKTFDTTGAGSWKGISRTDTALYNKKGYMLFVRGDRSVTGAGMPATATTLRSSGMVFHPVTNIPPVTDIGNGKFESVGNPYASAIDFSNDGAVIKSANVQRIFYVWDPKLGGNLNLGAYQTFIKGDGPDYTVLPGGGSYGANGSVQNLIQSGQSFFVHTFGGTGTISFTENAKVSGSSLVTRPVSSNTIRSKQLRTSLYAVRFDSAVLLDGVMHAFDAHWSDAIDINDAIKLVNVNESIGISSGHALLSVERRGNIRATDTLFYRLSGLKLGQYECRFIPAGLQRAGQSAFLEDAYLHTSTPISLTATSSMRFIVTNDPGSYAANRFRLVFKQRRSPVILKNIDIETVYEGKAIRIFPNPVTDKTVVVSFYRMPEGKYRLQLQSRSGQVLMEKNIRVTGKQYKENVQLPAVAAGTYQLIATDQHGSITTEIIVLK